MTVLLNAVGVSERTSPTSKDEYHRVFRTALTMIEENVWFVPLLDGNPRIEKPPFRSLEPLKTEIVLFEVLCAN